MTTPILYCLVTGSAITDVIKNKIFNSWLLLGMIIGIIISLCENSQDQTITAILLKAAITFFTLLPIYIIKGIGGGDLKLLTIISIFLSPGEIVSIITIAFLIGGILGMMKVIKEKNIHQTIHFALPIMISTLLVTGKSILVCI